MKKNQSEGRYEMRKGESGRGNVREEVGDIYGA